MPPTQTPADTAIELDLGPVTIGCTAEELSAAVAGLLHEMQAAAPFITPDERDALRRIMASDGPPAVADVFPDFARESAAHVTLRKLRTAQFIRPAGPDRWDPDGHIEVRPFARLLWDRVGEVGIFGAADDPSEDIDLSLPGVEEPTPAPVKGKRAGAWDEADVLDFLNDDERS